MTTTTPAACTHIIIRDEFGTIFEQVHRSTPEQVSSTLDWVSRNHYTGEVRTCEFCA